MGQINPAFRWKRALERYNPEESLRISSQTGMVMRLSVSPGMEFDKSYFYGVITMNIKYRKYKNEDNEVVFGMIKALYRKDPGGKPISDENIELTIRELPSHPDKGSIIMFDNDGEIVGYSILVNYWSNEYGGNILLLDELYISPDFRGKGIGTAFVKDLIKNRFNNSVAIKLEVTPANVKAGKLYERIGFRLTRNSHMMYEFD